MGLTFFSSPMYYFLGDAWQWTLFGLLYSSFSTFYPMPWLGFYKLGNRVGTMVRMCSLKFMLETKAWIWQWWEVGVYLTREDWVSRALPSCMGWYCYHRRALVAYKILVFTKPCSFLFCPSISHCGWDSRVHGPSTDASAMLWNFLLSTRVRSICVRKSHRTTSAVLWQQQQADRDGREVHRSQLSLRKGAT